MKGKGKKGRLGITVLVDSSSCSNSSSHASDSDRVVSLSRALRGGYVGGTYVNHPMASTHSLENATVDKSLEVGVQDPSTVSRSFDRLMGLVEKSVCAAKDGGKVKVMAELHSKGVSGWDMDASRSVTTSA